MYKETLRLMVEMMQEATEEVRRLIEHNNHKNADEIYGLFLRIAKDHEALSIKEAELEKP